MRSIPYVCMDVWVKYRIFPSKELHDLNFKEGMIEP